jgi:hypothetical protein
MELVTLMHETDEMMPKALVAIMTSTFLLSYYSNEEVFMLYELRNVEYEHYHDAYLKF